MTQKAFSLDLLYQFFSISYKQISQIIIAVISKKWGYITLHLTNFIGAIIMIIFCIMVPIINVKCNKFDNDTSSTTTTNSMSINDWNSMWHRGFHQNMIFGLIIIYCLFIFFGLFSRRIIHNILTQFQPTTTYQLFIYQYHRITFLYGQGAQINNYHNAGSGKRGRGRGRGRGKGKYYKKSQY